MIPLMSYAENFYSQAGEDGIIAELCRRLDVSYEAQSYYVDIGAGDGLYMSNTEHLRRQRWYGTCHEASFEKAASAFRRVIIYPGNYILPVEVTVDTVNGLSPHEWPVALLSMDIDGPDIHVWRALTAWRATIVIMEVHAEFPLGHLHEPRIDAPAFGKVTKDNPEDWPASFSSMLAVGLEKDYRLVAYTGLNMIFVDAGRGNAEEAGCPQDPNTLYLNGPQRTRYRELVEHKTQTREALAALADELQA